MPRTKRISGALRGHGTALALAGAAAAAVASVAGTASAATVSPANHAAATARPDNFSLGSSAGTLTGSGSVVTLTGTLPAHHAAAAVAAKAPKSAPHAIPARRPVQLAASTHHSAATRPSDSGRPARDSSHIAVGRPYEIYDSVTPAQIPGHHRIATYADGGYAVSPSAVSHHRNVLWIDTNGSDPRAAVLDVEPGDATPSGAATWARAKLTADPNGPAIIYTMRSDWSAVRAAIGSLPRHMQSEVRYWIADPTGTPHIVPGASATQWYWGSNYDISSAHPGF
ncbi:MAG: hypothetical protein WAL16_14420 [Streptosporangiaceae bacterium]